MCDYLEFKFIIDLIYLKKAQISFINFLPEAFKYLKRRLKFELEDKSDTVCGSEQVISFL